MYGRLLEPDPERSWMGHSVGRWQGDTLVVDSFGFNDRTWLDARGLPHTEGLRMTERYRRRSVGQMQVEIIVTDPAAFGGSWTATQSLQLQPDTEMIEAVCEDKTRWIGRLSEAERDAVSVPASILAKYVGVYSGLWGPVRVRTVQVRLEGGALYVNGLLGEKVRLIPHPTTSFIGTDGYSFDFDPAGDPAAFMVERHVSGDWKYICRPRSDDTQNSFIAPPDSAVPCWRRSAMRAHRRHRCRARTTAHRRRRCRCRGNNEAGTRAHRGWAPTRRRRIRRRGGR
jgi:hypothetical protein